MEDCELGLGGGLVGAVRLGEGWDVGGRTWRRGIVMVAMTCLSGLEGKPGALLVCVIVEEYICKRNAYPTYSAA